MALAATTPVTTRRAPRSPAACPAGAGAGPSAGADAAAKLALKRRRSSLLPPLLALIDSKAAENRKTTEAIKAVNEVKEVVPYSSEDEAPAAKKRRFSMLPQRASETSITIKEPGVEGPYVVAKALRDSLRGQVMNVVSAADKRASLARATVKREEMSIEETMKSCSALFEKYLQQAEPRTPEEQQERSQLREQLACGAERVLAAMETVCERSKEPAAANDDAEAELLLTVDDSIEAMRHGIETLTEMKGRVEQKMRQRRRASLPGDVASFPKLLQELGPVEAFQKQFVAETEAASKRKNQILHDRLKNLEEKKVIFMKADLNPARDYEYSQTLRGIKKAQEDIEKSEKDAARRATMAMKVDRLREELQEACAPPKQQGLFARWWPF